MNKIFSFFLVSLIWQISFGQNYVGNIHTVEKNGLHQILLTPEIRSAADNNLNHIRILDSKNNEVPYVSANKNISSSNFESFEIISKKVVDTASTSIIILNKNLKKLDELILEISNTNVDKIYNISGSNDNKEWFGLVYNQTIQNLKEQGKTSIKRNFSFPLNNYKYLKFEFIDKNSLPINILSAGINSHSFAEKEQINLENFNSKFFTNTSHKQTKIIISFENPQIINEIKFNIAAPNFYLRKARIYVNKSQKIKTNDKVFEETILNFELNSNKPNQFKVSNLFAKEFIIEINNADNPPLEISEIDLFQNPENLIADLKAKENYTILVDNNLKEPTYDLVQSGINLNIKYPKTTISGFEKIVPQESIEGTISFWQTSVFMWICIVLAVLILGYFTVSMIKDVEKK